MKYSSVAGKILASGRSQYHGTTTKHSRSLGEDLAFNPKKQAVCAAQEGGVQEVVQALWSPEGHEYNPDVKY